MRAWCSLWGKLLLAICLIPVGLAIPAVFVFLDLRCEGCENNFFRVLADASVALFVLCVAIFPRLARLPGRWELGLQLLSLAVCVVVLFGALVQFSLSFQFMAVLVAVWYAIILHSWHAGIEQVISEDHPDRCELFEVVMMASSLAVMLSAPTAFCIFEIITTGTFYHIFRSLSAISVALLVCSLTVLARLPLMWTQRLCWVRRILWGVHVVALLVSLLPLLIDFSFLSILTAALLGEFYALLARVWQLGAEQLLESRYWNPLSPQGRTINRIEQETVDVVFA